MLRCAISAFRSLRPLSIPCYNTTRIICNDYKGFSTLNKNVPQHISGLHYNYTLVNNKQILNIANSLTPIPCRSVTKFSLKRGKRKTVKAVIRRFFRLHWGGWIRTKVGRHKKLWKKSSSQKRRLRQHVTLNATQSRLMDKMVTKFWKKPKYYIDDPYEPYHTREEFSITRRKPFHYNKE